MNVYDEALTHENFMLFCAKWYQNPQCISTEEFLEDLSRIKYVKKLCTRYEQTGELKERLILNHLIILNNCFGPRVLPRILYLKMEKQFHLIKPFLILLNILPRKILNVGKNAIIETDNIPLDQTVVAALRKI